MKRLATAIAVSVLSLSHAFAAAAYEAELIFDPKLEDHGHAHASCIVECPNGDLLAVWYENGPKLPPPYFSEQLDKSDDVRIGGSRKPAGAAHWEKPFVASDTFGVSDNNPCMVIDRQQRLWLIHPTLLGVPAKTWGSALVQYKVSSDYQKAGPPRWDKERILVPHPESFEAPLSSALERFGRQSKQTAERLEVRVRPMLKDPFSVRLGWMPRAHPLILSDGTLLLPLSNENFNVAVMFFTKDAGETWTLSDPVPEAGVTQPTVVEFPDKTLAAFFRNGRPERRILRSESTDGGMSWTPLTLTDRPHPGAGIEALVLQSGLLVLVYNDLEKGRHSLAVSLSSDRGKTWPWTRHLENTPDGRFDYPSIIQSRDGTLHVTYSVNTKTIKHARFDEAWVKAGDQQ